MMTRSTAAAAFGLAVLQSMAAASAADIDFSLTTSQEVEVRCNGPWVRISPCAHLQASGAAQKFYTAEDNFLDPYGSWHCQVHKKVRREFCSVSQLGYVEFCVLTPKVDLKWDGSSLTVNQTPRCRLAQAKSVLGQDGEDAVTRQDIDTFAYAGQRAEQVDVELIVDGSNGAINGEATLRVVDPPNNVLAEKKGELPLRLKATLNGEVQIQVVRGTSPNAFRGFYQLEVTPAGGVGQRLLRPTESVEE